MDTMTLPATGDIILGENSGDYFVSVHEMLRSASLVVGLLEVPYSDKAPEPADLHRGLKNLKPLKQYFHILSLAGNHISDAKDTEIHETTGWLKRNNIQYVGSGLNRIEFPWDSDEIVIH